MSQKFAAFALAAAFMLGAAQAEIMVSNPAIKLGIGERPAVLHAQIMNHGSEALNLIGATSPAFERIELHTHKTDARGMMRMMQVTRYALPVHGTLSLKPGGDHLMLFGYQGAAGDKVDVTLNFSDGTTTKLSAPTMARQKRGSKPHSHHGH